MVLLSCVFLYTPVLLLASSGRISLGWAKDQDDLYDHENYRDPVPCGNDLYYGSDPFDSTVKFQTQKDALSWKITMIN